MSFKNLLAFQKRTKKRLVDNPQDNVEQLIYRATAMVHSRVQESIQRDPKTGATYGKHQASAAGEAPATDTGFLVGSITFKKPDVNEATGEVVGRVIASAPYAAHLEFGTSNIAPRPYMQPALEQNRSKIRKIFREGGLIK